MDEQVNIPALLLVFDGVTQSIILGVIWLCALLVADGSQANPGA